MRNSGGSTSSDLPWTVELNKYELEPRRSKRARIAKDFGTDFYAYTLEEDPNTLQEALTFIDAEFWQEAINDEMESLESNNTWHLLDLRDRKSVV